MAWTSRALLDNLISLEERNERLEKLAERNAYDSSEDGTLMREAILGELKENQQTIQKLIKKFRDVI